MTTSEDKQARKIDRRAFFRTSGGAAVVAAATVSTGAEPALATESEQERKKPRYQESEHVKTFYRVNRY